MSLDWMMIAVLLIAGLLLAGALVRTDDSDQTSRFGSFAGGVRTLSETERLTLFETYDFGAEGWQDAPAAVGPVGIGGVIGPLPAGAGLTRDLPLPEGTRRAVLSLDLIGIDDWADEALTLSVQGQEVLTLRPTTREDRRDSAGATPQGTPEIAVIANRLAPPAERGYAAGDAARREDVWRIRIAVEAPGRTLRLAIAGDAAGETAGDDREAIGVPQWALDNLSVVADLGR
jgi:hypothetical protein